MTCIGSEIVTIGVHVERFDSEWIPLRYRMFWCKQRNVNVQEWAAVEVDLLSVHGFIPAVNRMKVGETRRYWVRMLISAYRDYWGEHDTEVEILKVRRA